MMFSVLVSRFAMWAKWRVNKERSDTKEQVMVSGQGKGVHEDVERKEIDERRRKRWEDKGGEEGEERVGRGMKRRAATLGRASSMSTMRLGGSGSIGGGREETTTTKMVGRKMSVGISRAFVSASEIWGSGGESDGRSQSRGREAFVSSGRGGAGNIHHTSSKSRDAIGRNEFAPTRGRELAVDSTKITSHGRGGAGNIRSRSRELLASEVVVTKEETRYEQDVIQRHVEAEKTSTALFSSGRGGAGNIARSRSKGPTRNMNENTVPAQTHSTGRGGAGNIVPGDGKQADNLDYEERKLHAHPDISIYSTGRGGAGNITEGAVPVIEHHQEANDSTTVHSSGRGGAGNIHHHEQHDSASRSRSPGTPQWHSTGRGGAGNIVSGADAAVADSIDYEDRKQHPHPEGRHSTGRGGAGNMTETPSPPVEHHPHDPELQSTGRGGAGNIYSLPTLLAKAHIRDK